MEHMIPRNTGWSRTIWCGREVLLIRGEMEDRAQTETPFQNCEQPDRDVYSSTRKGVRR
jgi:hypothetical protein